MRYTKVLINNNIRRALEDGLSNDKSLDIFLMMSMMNDLPKERPFIMNGPSPNEVHVHLIGNDDIEEDDIQLKMVKSNKYFTQKLMVKLSPVCTLYAERYHSTLKVTINENEMTGMYLKPYLAEDIALWMIRQKQNLDKYIDHWDAVFENACKKAKSRRMAYVSIRAIFTEAMKDYPKVKYEFVEQKRRVRIKVMLPNTHLGVYLDAWWGSYRESLPKQIESLKLIIEAHSKSTLANYFVYH